MSKSRAEEIGKLIRQAINEGIPLEEILAIILNDLKLEIKKDNPYFTSKEVNAAADEYVAELLQRAGLKLEH